MGVVADFDLAALAFNGLEATKDMVWRRRDVLIDQMLDRATGDLVLEVRPWPPTGYFVDGVWVEFAQRLRRHLGFR